MMNLNFECPDACKQTYPFHELITHKQKNLCRKGYIRPKQDPKFAIEAPGPKSTSAQ